MSGTKKIVFIAGFLVLFLFVLLLVNEERKDAYEKSLTENYRKEITVKFNKVKKMLIGRELKSIKTIIPDSLDKVGYPYILFLFTGNDCSGCIKKGFEIVKKIEDSTIVKKVFVISSNVNNSIYQFNNDYYRYIYPDNKDCIRRELRFIFTPAFITLDSLFIIKDLYFPLNIDADSVSEGYIRKISGFNQG